MAEVIAKLSGSRSTNVVLFTISVTNSSQKAKGNPTPSPKEKQLEQERGEEEFNQAYEQYRRRELQAFLDDLSAEERKKIEGLAEAHVQAETQLDPDYPVFERTKRYYMQEIITERVELGSIDNFRDWQN